MRYVVMGLLGAFLFSGVCRGADELEMRTETQRINYSVGYQIGKDFRNQGVKLDSPALVHGIRDALRENKPKMTQEEMNKTLVDLKKKITALEIEKKKARAEKYRAEGKAFLEENAKKEGVVTLPSGLQYRVLREGNGEKPAPDDTVEVKYQGTLLKDGTFASPESQKQKPVTVPIANAIPAWREALPLMKVGAKWRLFVRPDLAFGHQGPMADRTVIYDIELISIQPPEEKNPLGPEKKKASP
jgi:FKBP-type peptidyl-prolyl cis-trans isomerase FklB